MLENLGAGEVEYELAEEFLIEIKKEFGGGEEELQKVAELKKNRTRRKNNGRVCSRFQKSSEREWVQGMPLD